MIAEYTAAYATIVGLLSAYATGRDVQKGLEIDEFIEWLIEHNHQKIVEEIQRNQATSIFVKAFLNREIPEIQLKLDSILALVQSLIERQSENSDAPVGMPLNHHYGKKMLTFLFEQFKSNRFSISNFDYALEETEYLLKGHLEKVNPYVLETMVRECLSSRISATEIVHKHWLNLIE
ncbi:hypothetical protein [Methylobacter sp. BlB1]|uniref:hypothetical protein n=1 Tax=Methylobacter sp. BlB1 TaxID=2785914 RepID=UPI0018941055|nr:hypothetical protein [Methylobacter sp. BlB1]MBF6650416.1 hypothetical protein [Methylobacter sp. BlB1]